MNITKISDDFAITSQVLPTDIADIAAAGYMAIICNRPDGEEAGQPCAEDIALACEEAGIAFHHIPVSGMPASQDLVDQHREVINSSAGPVLGYCRTGQRARYLWNGNS